MASRRVNFDESSAQKKLLTLNEFHGIFSELSCEKFEKTKEAIWDSVAGRLFFEAGFYGYGTKIVSRFREGFPSFDLLDKLIESNGGHRGSFRAKTIEMRSIDNKPPQAVFVTRVEATDVKEKRTSFFAKRPEKQRHGLESIVISGEVISYLLMEADASSFIVSFTLSSSEKRIEREIMQTDDLS